MSDRFRLSDRERRTLIMAAALTTALVVALGTPRPGDPHPSTDIGHEWIAERALLAGLPMNLPVGEMRERLGIDLPTADVHQPRTPGGLLVNLWLVLIPESAMLTVTLVITGLAAGAFVLMAEAILDRRIHPLLVPALLSTTAFRSMFLDRSTVWITALSVGAVWLLARRGDWRAGLALIPAVTLRLWPGIFIPYLWVRGQRRAAAVATVGATGLNLLGVALPNVTWAGTLETLETPLAYAAGSSNTTMVGAALRAGLPHLAALAVGALIVVLGYRWASRRSFSTGFGVLVWTAMVAAPTAWPHYRTVLLPVALGHPVGWLGLVADFGWPFGFTWGFAIGSVLIGLGWAMRKAPAEAGADLRQVIRDRVMGSR